MIKTIMIGAMIAVAAPAAALTLTVSNGGDGFLDTGPAPYEFTLFSSDNGPDSTVLYSTTATTAQLIHGNYSYHTDDRDGAFYDPAGYEVNGSLHQLSPATSLNGFTGTGSFAFAVNAGDTYGYYIRAIDGQLGRGSLSIDAVPEPMTWALLITGFGMVGAAARHRRSTAVAA